MQPELGLGLGSTSSTRMLLSYLNRKRDPYPERDTNPERDSNPNPKPLVLTLP